MVYKILIEFKLTPTQPVSDENVAIELRITNIGDSPFLGGELTEFSLRIHDAGQSVSKSTLQKIPALNVNESVMLKPHTFSLLEGGIAWVRVQIKASDGQEVNLFQNPEYNMGSVWSHVFAVKQRENETIIELLHRIVKLLEEKKEQ